MFSDFYKYYLNNKRYHKTYFFISELINIIINLKRVLLKDSFIKYTPALSSFERGYLLMLHKNYKITNYVRDSKKKINFSQNCYYYWFLPHFFLVKILRNVTIFKTRHFTRAYWILAFFDFWKNSYFYWHGKICP